ncbi:hypothetical protein [Polyangium fumosum]|uniref:Uncharacterized protein n=1 Tax=Polyangium fumosum TaxID=889272 RepID=A0A4V5PRV1_9BACT|nr:hypothetical protein [Polyangium fumosum]TKD03410.1 hypothetical protein E8A74_25950 [Polyangium fumosum]
MAGKNGAVADIRQAQRKMAAAGGRHIGDIVGWNTERINVSRERARVLLQPEGFDHLILDVDPATALSRAAGEVKRPSGILVQPFANPNGDTPASFGIYVRRSGGGEAGDQYPCGARCRVALASSRVVSLPPDGAPGLEEAMAHAENIAAQANHLIAHCETKDISGALVAMVKALSGVPLRNRGGMYLLPPSSCERWQRLKPALEDLRVEPITIVMHDAPDNLATAKSAAQGALEADIGELLKDLEKATTDGMRQDALTRRVQFCNELVAKAELYRGVLAGVSDKITTKVKELKDSFQRQLAGGGGGGGVPSEPSFTVPITD